MKKINIKEAGTNGAALIAGAIVANLVNSKLATKVTNPKMRNAIPFALGLFLLTNKSAMIKMAGAGMAAVGGSRLLGAAVPALAGVCGVGELEGVYDELIQGVGDDMGEIEGVLNGDDMGEIKGVLNGNPDYME